MSAQLMETLILWIILALQIRAVAQLHLMQALAVQQAHLAAEISYSQTHL